MDYSKQDEKILSYNDVVLRRSDLGILKGPHFINDRIIEFYFSFLSSSTVSEDILLVPPSISFWIANCPDPESLKDVIEPLKLQDKNLVLFTVNDNSDVNLAQGGTHWSLLAYSKNLNTFVHHDSCSELNTEDAKKLYQAVRTSVASTARFEVAFTPQQKNSYDCGVYVMAIARAICAWHESETIDKGEDWFSTLTEINASTVSCVRKEILEQIQMLMTQK
ncbi:NEDD8-specific protease 1 [Acorus calamus]|uniref:NEDD8-specific protease 1 n=1 Tax=Acorus calamus TaxID=4465 RepID=A0AAV9FJ54_ACOCL|nr:NEDD8-specific protease 1 [Acorus calamus]